MDPSLKVMFTTYVLAGVVSLFMAVLIHVMSHTIKRFFAAPLPAADADVSQQGGSVEEEDNGGEVEIAIAIAAARAYAAKG